MHLRTAAATAGLVLAGPLFLAGPAAADSHDADFVVELTGEAEMPDPGDPDGTGTATLTFGEDSICYTLEVADIEPAAAAHIHEGGPDVAGPIVVPLEEVPAEGMSSGCADVDPALIAEIMDNPGDYYVNVHNAEFQAGAVRGQLTQMPVGGVETGGGGTAGWEHAELLLAGAIALTVGVGGILLATRATPAADSKESDSAPAHVH